ncbi:MAG: GNAT family N-acetyltransferase [Anaerolineae bacterium]|jgi:predicted acetyltransferase|nr:GNAT family N-acetyltransferase [Anaerolineae bacterium]MBT7071213.1 GNAT family N-acetyltransferase [Anaerolineae bacterium]MBT7324125.1 GNAT family N-acetyltransferase [Anaerolineae bacterium]
MKSKNVLPYPITPAKKDDHLMDVAKITSDTYANGQHLEEISKVYFANCHYDWDTSRLAFDGDDLIHHWGVWGFPMRLGAAQVKVAGVGAVVTRKAYRKQGLMQKAALASFEAMRESGYDLSILRGRHYAKFGYARAWNYVTYRLNAEEIPKFTIKQSYEVLGPQHMNQIIALYNREYADFSSTVLRPTYRMLEVGDMGAYGWFSKEKLIGYVRAEPSEDKKSLQCLEATGDAEQGLAVLGELFRKGNYETLAFFTLPKPHPMLQIIRRGACIVEDKYFYHSGWQVKIINLYSLIEKLTPALQARLEKSHLASWTGALALDAGDQQVTLSITAGKLNITSESAEYKLIGGAALGRLLIGSDESNEIFQQENITCTKEVLELANTLFPNLHPVMSHWDEY